MIVNTFQGKAAYPYAAFDLETKTYIDGKLLTDAQIKTMCAATKRVKGKDVPLYPVSWWREHAEVKCWAYIIYEPDGFAIAETWEEFCEVLIRHRISCGWFYNAPFDFSVLDYDMLSRGYKHVERAKNVLEYSELSNDFGARYSLTAVVPFTRAKGDRSQRESWKFTAYDLRNIFGGGLSNLLKEFDVKDGDGNPVRKLEMDYQGATGTEEDIAYMLNDAAGLWWLIQTAGARMSELYGVDIRNGKPDVLTASGLAKKVFLREMYPYALTDTRRRFYFRREHPITLAQDTAFRAHGLLGGGLVIINPDVRGKTLRNIKAFRYDVNSEYPYYMENMRSIIGHPSAYSTLKEAREWHAPTDCYILKISQLDAYLRPNAVPSWRNPITGEIESEYHIDEIADSPVMIFLEEWEELTRYWYNVTNVKIDAVYVYPTHKEPAIGRVIRREYARKAEARELGDGALASFSKLIMNGYGGKYSQNPHRTVNTRQIIDGAVRLIQTGEECDEKDLMQVVQGARITCGGRCLIRKFAREVCRGNMRDNLLYIDTDSLHVLCEAPEKLIDKARLGALKRENKTPIVEACFLAPKTYFELEESGDVEIHAKGVRIEEIKNLVKRGTPLSQIYREGFRVCSLSALNVKGGKALLPLPKQIARVTNLNNVDERTE